MKKAVLAVLSLCAAAFAQSLIGLNLPLGMPANSVAGPASSMAGSGTAIIDEYHGTALNPANVAIGGRAAFSGLVSFDHLEIRDNSGDASVSGYSPKLLSLILPLGGSGNIGFSMQRQYDANLNFFTTRILEDDLNYKSATIQLQNVGGLTAWQAGWGYRFKNNMSFGLMYQRLFFNSESRNVYGSTFRYGNGLSFQSSMEETIITSFASNGMRFGLQMPVHEKVTAGVAAEYVFYSDKSGLSKREYLHVEGRQIDTLAPLSGEGKFSVHLPPSINAGLSYKPNNQWLLAIDGHCTMWERYYNSLDRANKFRTTYGVSLGSSFIPSTNRMSAKYWEIVHYRAGLRYSQLALDGAQEYMMSFGTGLPIPNDGGLIDIIFGYGRRTADRYKGYSENVTKFELGINGGRNWFQKTTARNH